MLVGLLVVGGGCGGLRFFWMIFLVFLIIFLNIFGIVLKLGLCWVFGFLGMFLLGLLLDGKLSMLNVEYLNGILVKDLLLRIVGGILFDFLLDFVVG